MYIDINILAITTIIEHVLEISKYIFKNPTYIIYLINII